MKEAQVSFVYFCSFVWYLLGGVFLLKVKGHLQ